MSEQLRLTRVLKDGRILAINIWATGFQELVFKTRKDFERAKLQVEVEGKPLNVGGFTTV